MLALFNDIGKKLSAIDEFTIFTRIGRSSLMHSFKSQVGKGSSEQDLFGEAIISCLTSSEDAVRNSCKVSVPENVFPVFEAGGCPFWILLHLYRVANSDDLIDEEVITFLNKISRWYILRDDCFLFDTCQVIC